MNTRTQAKRGRGNISGQIVLEYAARLFNQNGFDRTSMNDIADALGVTKPSIYYYFKSKDEIVTNIIINAKTVFLTNIDEELEKQPNILAKIMTFLKLYMNEFSSDLFRLMVFADERTLSPAGQKILTKGKKEANDILVTLLKQASKEGVIHINDPKNVSYAIFGMYNWMISWRGNDWSQDASAIEKEFEKLVFCGLISKPKKLPKTI